MDPNGCWMWFSGLLELGMFIWLVVWNMNFIFPYIGNFMIPTDELIFFRGVGIHQPVWEASLFQEGGEKPCWLSQAFLVFWAGYLRVRVSLAMNNANGMYVVQKIHIICMNIYIYILTIKNNNLYIDGHLVFYVFRERLHDVFFIIGRLKHRIWMVQSNLRTAQIMEISWSFSIVSSHSKGYLIFRQTRINLWLIMHDSWSYL